MGLQTLRTALLLLTIIVFGSGLGTAQSQQTPPVTQGQQTPSGTAGLLLAKEGLSDYEKGNLALQFLTLIVLTCTLVKLFQYTRDTRRLADAAVEEMSRPCVVLYETPDPSDMAVVKGHSSSLSHGPLVFRNIGTGPALNFRFTYRTSPSAYGTLAGPSIPPG